MSEKELSITSYLLCKLLEKYFEPDENGDISYVFEMQESREVISNIAKKENFADVARSVVEAI